MYDQAPYNNFFITQNMISKNVKGAIYSTIP